MENKFYIKDSTINKIVYFTSVAGVVKHLENLVRITEGKTRPQFMHYLSELGHGYDDANGVTFTRTMAEKFEIGYVNRMGNLVRTDIHNISSFTNEEFGD